jgi:diacylglycerol kinase (ATP)
MRRSAAIIVNPISGHGIGLKRAKRARRILEKAGLDVEVYLTEGPGHGSQLTKEKGISADVIISVGGDGTLNEIVNGLVETGSDTPIAIVPTGTANVVSRELGLPSDVTSQVRLAVDGPVRRLDLGCAGNRQFIMSAGAGFDAAVVNKVSMSRTDRSITMLNYVIPCLREGMRYPFPAMRVTVDGMVVDERSTFTVVGNMRRYGGIFQIFKDACPDDGMLHVCCMHASNLLDLFRYSWGGFFNRLCEFMGVTYYQGKRITIEADEQVFLQIDGDPSGQLPRTFELLPKAAGFCVNTPPPWIL